MEQQKFGTLKELGKSRGLKRRLEAAGMWTGKETNGEVMERARCKTFYSKPPEKHKNFLWAHDQT